MICGNFLYFILVHDSNKLRMPICYEQSKMDMNTGGYERDGIFNISQYISTFYLVVCSKKMITN